MLRKPSRAFDESSDAWVTLAMRHLSADNSSHHVKPCKEPQFDPVIHESDQLFSDAANPKRRWLLQALLLTDEPITEIANRTGLSVATVETYGQLFFDVRSRIRARDWLLYEAVRCAPWRNFAGADTGCLWRYYARFGGIHVLDVVMAATGDAPWPDSLARSVGSDDPQDIERFKMKVRLTVNGQNAEGDEAVATIVGLMQNLRSLPNAMPLDQCSPELRQHENFLIQLPSLKRKAKAGEKRKGQSTAPGPEKCTPTNNTPQRIRKPK